MDLTKLTSNWTYCTGSVEEPRDSCTIFGLTRLPHERVACNGSRYMAASNDVPDVALFFLLFTFKTVVADSEVLAYHTLHYTTVTLEHIDHS